MGRPAILSFNFKYLSRLDIFGADLAYLESFKQDCVDFTHELSSICQGLLPVQETNSRTIKCGSKMLQTLRSSYIMSTTLQGFFFKARASTTCQRPYKVITIIIHTRVSSKCHQAIQVVGSMTFARASWPSSGIPRLYGLLQRLPGLQDHL